MFISLILQTEIGIIRSGYITHNPIPNPEAIPGIPGNFREPPFDNDEWTAEADFAFHQSLKILYLLLNFGKQIC